MTPAERLHNAVAFAYADLTTDEQLDADLLDEMGSILADWVTVYRRGARELRQARALADHPALFPDLGTS